MDSKTQGNPWASAPRASSLSYNPYTNPNNNEQGSHWGLLPCDTNEWKCQVYEFNTFIVQKKFSKPEGPFLYMYPYFEDFNSFFNVHIIENLYLSLMYITVAP